MKLRLHTYWRSSATYRVRIALNLKELAYEPVIVNILANAQESDEYRGKNPMAQVPTLEVEENDGRVHVLTQSLPIIEYLEERWPEHPLLPRDREQRAHARALAEIVNSGIQPLQNLSVTRRLQAAGVDDKAWVQHFISRGLAAFEHALELGGSTAGWRFAAGDAPTIADCCLVPQLYAARRFGVDPSGYPRIAAIGAACEALPAFAAAHPDRQPDAPEATP
jgi:maleylpyruvate isomerase